MNQEPNQTNGFVAPELGEYKGQPTLTLRKRADDKYPFTFGKTKAKLIVAYFEYIKHFAES